MLRCGYCDIYEEGEIETSEGVIKIAPAWKWLLG